MKLARIQSSLENWSAFRRLFLAEARCDDVSVGNLGGYESITTMAKAAGGPDKWIANIEKGASIVAKRSGRAEGAVVTLVLCGAVWVGYEWKKRSALRNAKAIADATLAKDQVAESFRHTDRHTERDSDDGA